MQPIDFHAYYWAGIAVAANKYGIELHRLSIGDDCGFNGEAVLEPVSLWCNLNVGLSTEKAMQVERYVTTLLAGSAGSLIRVQDQRGQIKRSLGDAGLEMRFLREVWHSVQREPDRAISIICGSLGAFDDGDVEATTHRLWHRAVRVLRQAPQHQQLKHLARELLQVKRMSDLEVARCLESVK